MSSGGVISPDLIILTHIIEESFVICNLDVKKVKKIFPHNPSKEILIDFILIFNRKLDTGKVNINIGKKIENLIRNGDKRVFKELFGERVKGFKKIDTTETERETLGLCEDMKKNSKHGYTLSEKGGFFTVYYHLCCSKSYPPSLGYLSPRLPDRIYIREGNTVKIINILDVFSGEFKSPYVDKILNRIY